MERLEDFAKRNAAFGDFGMVSKKEMQKCYDIALQVEKTYNEKHGNTNEPQVGDIVEFADDFHVYKSGKIVENLYGGSEYGMICVCQNGSSHTDGVHFSTSGGAFHAVHKSKLRLVGDAENIVWTWGCYGAGANQGIYFPLKVRKWIIPYEPPKFASKVRINVNKAKTGDGCPLPVVWIENFGEFYFAQSFRSVKAFKAWADYVGYKHFSFNGTFERRSPMRITNRCVLDVKDVPADAKPMKVLANGKIHDGWVTNDGKTITSIWLNKFNPDEFKDYGTEAYKKRRDEEWAMYRKYQGNPMGV